MLKHVDLCSEELMNLVHTDVNLQGTASNPDVIRCLLVVNCSDEMQDLHADLQVNVNVHKNNIHFTQ